MEFIAGFTEGGVSYGIFEEDLEIDVVDALNIKLIVLNLIYAKYQISEGKERALAQKQL